MRKFYAWTLIILTFTACTMDENNNPDSGNTDASNGMLERIPTGYPENPVNEHDLSGKIHFELCDGYLDGEHLATSLTEAISQTEQLAFGNPEFLLLKPLGYTAPTATRLAYILEDKPGRVAEVIDQSLLSWRAKVSLANFISSVEWYRDQKADYSTVYKFTVDYEDSIAADATFSATDKRILLTTTSITRYALYFAKKEKEKEPKRRDRDWDISMGNIAAGTDGANESTAKAITMATAAALYVNR